MFVCNMNYIFDQTKGKHVIMAVSGHGAGGYWFCVIAPVIVHIVYSYVSLFFVASSKSGRMNY